MRRKRSFMCVAITGMIASSVMASSPPLPVSANTIQSFVPPGYVIEQTVEADFVRDGCRDAAVLVVPANADGENLQETAQRNADQRQLLLLLRTSAHSFRLSAAKRIISGVGNHGDHFYGMGVNGRTLFLKGGGTSLTGQVGYSSTFQFRFQNGDWFLTGFEVEGWNRCSDFGNDNDTWYASYAAKPHLRPGEVCVEVDRTVNQNDSVQETTWYAAPGRDSGGNGERKIVAQDKFQPGPLSRLMEQDLSFWEE